MIAVIASQSNPDVYFSKRQQSILIQMSNQFQSAIEILLSSKLLHQQKLAYTILEILDLCEISKTVEIENFFIIILDNPSDKICIKVEELLEIYKEGWGLIFSQFASNKKKQNPDSDDVLEIIDLFYKVIKLLPPECPQLHSILPYDQGGKDMFLEIIRDPIKISKLYKQYPSISVQQSIEENFLEQYQKMALSSTNFDKLKSSTIKYLACISNENRLSIETYLNFFKLLQTFPDYKTFSDLERNTITFLVIKLTTKYISPTQNFVTLEHIKDLLQMTLKIREYYGEEFLIYFLYAPNIHDIKSLKELAKFFHHLMIASQNPKIFSDITVSMNKFSKGKLSFQDLFRMVVRINTEKVISEDKQNLEIFFQRWAGNIYDPSVVFSLPEEKLKKVCDQYKIVCQYCQDWKLLSIGQLVDIALSISSNAQKNQIDEDQTLKIVAIGRLAILSEFKMYLYTSQVCSVLAKLLYPKGIIAQIKTGEGKSKEATLLAFVLAMIHPKQGHIISSSPSLAIRDQNEHEAFFEIFGISTSHICNREPNESYFQSKILYGTATDFEFAIMREMLYFESLFPEPINEQSQKRFRWVIVDELDNLTIDTSKNGARLAAQAEISYNWVYKPIFSFVEKYLPKELDQPLCDKFIERLRENLKNFREGQFLQQAESFSKKRLILWMQSAHKAIHHLKEKEHYIIGDRKTKNSENVKGILIVDAENTGKILHQSRWSFGIHEFLEIKHNLDLEPESICPISISHPVFYQFYHSIFGITGTAGSETERSELKKIYGLESFDVPTHRPVVRKDYPTRVFKTVSEHLHYIVESVKKCKEKRRPILILTEKIIDSESIAKILKEEGLEFQLFNEIQIDSEETILKKAGNPGAITVATNNAGRGTDIKLSQESKINGGLHVLITFYPQSYRVEMQARGRAGRQGDKGSSELVICKEKLDESFSFLDDQLIIQKLQYDRSSNAIIQRDDHIIQSYMERKTFALVSQFYNLLKNFHFAMEKETVIKKISTYLSHRKFLKQENRDLTHLIPQNRAIAEMILDLFNERKIYTLKWNIVTKQITKRLEKLMIDDFSLNFNPVVADMIENAGLSSNLFVANKLKEFSQKIDNQNVELKQAIVTLEINSRKSFEIRKNELLANIQSVFDEKISYWQKHLDVSGIGVMHFIEEITKIDAIPTAASSIKLK